MIWEVLPLILIFLGFGSALIFLVKKSESISDEEVNKTLDNIKLVKLIKIFSHQKIKPKLQSRVIEEKTLLFVEKELRWLRILALKLENWLTKQIDGVKNLRVKPEADPLYWLSVRRDALEKKINEVFQFSFNAKYDPFKEEEKLVKKGIEDINEWLKIVKFHLERDDISEARRLIIRCWKINPDDEKLKLLLERFHLSLEEDQLKEEKQS